MSLLEKLIALSRVCVCERVLTHTNAHVGLTNPLGSLIAPTAPALCADWINVSGSNASRERRYQL